MIDLLDRWQRLQAIEQVPEVSQEVQTVIMLGGPYPETRNTWVQMIDHLDPLAGRWLAWAFEAYRITPRVHSRIMFCAHPEAKFFASDPVRVTCMSCRILNDLEVVGPLASLESMGDAVPDMVWTNAGWWP